MPEWRGGVKVEVEVFVYSVDEETFACPYHVSFFHSYVGLLHHLQTILSTTFITSLDLSEAGRGLPVELSQSTPLVSPYDCRAISPLECRENSPYCIPKVTQFMLNDTDFRIIIAFSEPTNQPPVPTLETLLTIVQPVPHLDLLSLAPQDHNQSFNGPGLNTTWSTPSTLDITCPPSLFWFLYQAALGGMVFRAMPKECPTMVFKGSFDLRLNEAGHYAMAFSYQSGSSNSNRRVRMVGPYRSNIIHVRKCESLLIHTDHHRGRPQVSH